MIDGAEVQSLFETVEHNTRPMRHGPICLPPYTRHQRFAEDVECSLPHDGFPRITSEGAEIVYEGLCGNFSRWAWGIGNHPLEVPIEHTSNVRICATEQGDHFVCHAYTGMHYPQTTKNQSLIPWFVFDKIDMHDEYNPRTSVELKSRTDWWASLALLLDDKGECAT